jgi:hypothetical protein
MKIITKLKSILGLLGSLFIPKITIDKTQIENEITPPTDEEDFNQFFLNFNGFPINKKQKQLFKTRYSRNNVRILSRQSGATTFLTTLCAWESLKGKKVMIAQSNQRLTTLQKSNYFNKCQTIGINPIPVDLFVANDRYTDKIRGKTYDICLYDCSSRTIERNWWASAKSSCVNTNGYCLLLQTVEVVDKQ